MVTGTHMPRARRRQKDWAQQKQLQLANNAKEIGCKRGRCKWELWCACAKEATKIVFVLRAARTWYTWVCAIVNRGLSLSGHRTSCAWVAWSWAMANGPICEWAHNQLTLAMCPRNGTGPMPGSRLPTGLASRFALSSGGALLNAIVQCRWSQNIEKQQQQNTQSEDMSTWWTSLLCFHWWKGWEKWMIRYDFYCEFETATNSLSIYQRLRCFEVLT